MSRRRPPNCTYCAEDIADTKDHVIPRCLFPRPYPSNLITVPACSACNRAKGIDDDYLRDFLVVDFAGSSSPAAAHVFETKVRRSVARNSSEVARAVIRGVRDKPLYTRGGIYIGTFPEAPLDEARFPALFGRIIRGLYFHHARKRIPSSYPVQVLRAMPWDADRSFADFAQLTLHRTGPLGDVFDGWCARVKEDPLSTAWFLSFYQRVHFQVVCLNPELPDIARGAVEIG